jgi:hypothetical protein
MTLVLSGSLPPLVAALKNPLRDLTRLVVMKMQRLSGDRAMRRDWSLPVYSEQRYETTTTTENVS